MTHEQLKTYESQLKPCPFCGAKGKVIHCIIYDGGFVTCSNPMCEVKASAKFSGTPEEAIKAWNTRSAESKVLEDIRAEIAEVPKKYPMTADYESGIREALSIIDKHIKGGNKT